MTKAGRPKAEKPRNKIVTFRMDEEMYKQLVKYAEAHHKTITKVIEECVIAKITER